MHDLKGKHILMVVAPEGFRDEELLVPKKAFEEMGASVSIASKGAIKAAGKLGASVDVDKDITAVDASSYDSVIFVGGSGASVYFEDCEALDLAKEAYDLGKVVAAICIAPSILANAGILSGKKATCFISEEANLKEQGADYTGNPVETDRKIITAKGPDATSDFAEAIASVLEK